MTKELVKELSNFFNMFFKNAVANLKKIPDHQNCLSDTESAVILSTIIFSIANIKCNRRGNRNYISLHSQFKIVQKRGNLVITLVFLHFLF